MNAEKTRILIVGESPVLPTGMAETLRLIFGALLKQFPGVYELRQIALFHSFPVAAVEWPLIPTKGEAEPDGRMRTLVKSDRYAEETFRKSSPRSSRISSLPLTTRNVFSTFASRPPNAITSSSSTSTSMARPSRPISVRPSIWPIASLP